MNPKANTLMLSVVCLVAAGGVLYFTPISDARGTTDEVPAKNVAAAPEKARASDPTSPAELTSRAEPAIKDAPIAAFQVELLDLAFGAASAFPKYPHIKNRSRAQEVVVVTALELDQRQRVLGYLEHIDNWRRGTGYADLAFHCALKGDTENVARYLERALEVANTTEDESVEDSSAQGWRKDRIRAKVARTHTWLGDTAKAAEFETGLADSEWGAVSTARAMKLEPAALDAELAGLERVVATRNFDQMLNALHTYAELYDRFYDDADRRARIETQARASLGQLPIDVRIQFFEKLADAALAREDREKAVSLLNEAQSNMAAAVWPAEHEIKISSRLAALRHRAGDTEAARKSVDALLAMYAKEKETIVNIYRARALRSIAEAYDSLGDDAAALDVYKQSVEAGAVHPASRPRADDLVATCCSMARAALAPDEALAKRLAEIRAGLSDPW